jgi:hypothetical protein
VKGKRGRPRKQAAAPEPEAAAEPVPPPVPAYGGRTPQVGMMVHFMQSGQPMPAMLHSQSAITGLWNLNVFGLGYFSARHGVHWSESPKECHWNWPAPETK